MIELGYSVLVFFKRRHFLYLFGFLVNFRPMNPFLNDILLTTKNITSDQYDTEIYPISSYTNAVLSLLILLTVSCCVFNSVLILYSISGLLYTVFIWQLTSTSEMQVAEGLRGALFASEILYFATIYICHDAKKNFASSTACIRLIPPLSQMVAAFLAQSCLSQGLLGYKELVFFSVPAFGHALLLLLHIPPLQENEDTPKSFTSNLKFIKSTLKEIYAIDHAVAWILWTACSLTGYIQLMAKIQTLWLLKNENPTFNGGVEGISALISFLAVSLSGPFQMDWNYHTYILMITSSLQAILIFVMSHADEVWICNLCYIVFGMVYHFVTTSISAEIAKKVHHKASFGITFGTIGCVAALLNLILVGFLYNKHLGLDINEKLMVTGIYHMVLGMLVLVFWLLKKLC